MVDANKGPSILEHVRKTVDVTVYDTKWIPCSARFVLLGSHSKSTGSIQVYELAGNDVKRVIAAEKPAAIKCGTFGASSLAHRNLATGDFDGNLHIWDLERLGTYKYHAKAHKSIINSIDGCGGLGIGHGAPEIVTGGRDGRVCVWDQRQKDEPVQVEQQCGVVSQVGVVGAIRGMKQE